VVLKADNEGLIQELMAANDEERARNAQLASDNGVLRNELEECRRNETDLRRQLEASVRRESDIQRQLAQSTTNERELREQLRQLRDQMQH
jgi:tRNA U34 5-carboxymethylaminomethyl modifying GTPase MnmE/TrmE